MYTYLYIEDLIQEGRELQWTAAAFEGRSVPQLLNSRCDAWVARVRGVLSGHQQPPDGWRKVPSEGREMARYASDVLDLLQRLENNP